MKCPYCAEEIKQEAKVCRYCGREILFIKSVLDRLSLLESRVEGISAPNDAVNPAVELIPPTKQEGMPFLFFGLIILLSVLVQVGSYWLYVHGYHDYFLSISLLWPFPVGLILGLSLRGVHVNKYLGLGSTLGLISFVGITVIYMYYINEEGGSGVFSWAKILSKTLLPYVLGTASLCTLGGLLGDLIERKKHPAAVADRGRVFGRPLSVYANAIVTLLTLILAILTTYYNHYMYLAAVKLSTS